jgi:N-hydroxyarylamine O-acetyltransferase
MDIDAYLKRLNYRASLAPTAATLRDLQVAHLQTVPFENLSIHAGEPIVLNDDALFMKIVTKKRGGFCYELNGLFAALLRSLGFDVAMLSAGVARPQGGFSPEFDHMALMVTPNDSPVKRWLVDVGFGESFPSRSCSTSEQGTGSTVFSPGDGKQPPDSNDRNDGEQWTNLYRLL